MKDRRTIGRYDIERVLGKGGMGIVWLAQDPSLSRQVALKHLREDLVLTPEQREDLFARMRIEARAAAHLTHPNVVTLHDVGEDEALGPWLVFEYVEGPSLRDELKHGPFPKDRLVQVARDVVAALAYAHDRNVLHRDVKPENVLASRTGMKLADFGVARLPDVQMTATGVLIGTPAYGAPESLRRAEFTPASDQFSLAVMLWELLKGSRPESIDESSLPTHVSSTRGAMSDESPTLPTAGSDAAERVLLRGMSPRPENRFVNVRAFGEAFVRALDPHATLGHTATLPPVGPSPRERRTQNVALALAVALLVALAFAGRIEAMVMKVTGGAWADAAIDAGTAAPIKKSVPKKTSVPAKEKAVVQAPSTPEVATPEPALAPLIDAAAPSP